ncbi:MAG: hypothetical protein WA459_02630 [Stellaceae bacterium]
MADLVFLPLLEIAQTLRQRRTSAEELVEAAIDRHEAFGDRLHGVPISIKDLFAAEGYACFFDLDTWRDYVTAAGFTELDHYHCPSGLPRERQPWLATVWRKA